MLPAGVVSGQINFSIHTDFAEVNTDNKLVQDIFCIGDSAFDGFVTISCYHYAGNDSVLLYKKSNEPVDLKKGNRKFRIVFSGDRAIRDPKFFNLLKNTGTLPAGEYKTYISFLDSTHVVADKIFIRSVDSTLGVKSPLKKIVDDILAPRKKGIISINAKAPSSVSKAVSEKKFKRSQKKIEKELKAKSVHAYFFTLAGNEVIDLYHDKIFIGRYKAGVAVVHQKNGLAMPDEFSAMADNDLGNYESIFSQSKKVKKNKNDENEVKGELGLSVNVSNDQEENSGQNNNYYELYGSIATEVMKLPVVIDGMYTSQDQNRDIKSSYIKVKYDIEKVKSDQKKQISGYKNNYNQTKAKSGMMQSTSQSFINMLEGQKGSLINELKTDKGFVGLNLDTVALRNKLEQEAGGDDSSSDMSERKRKVDEKYRKAMEKYRKLEETEKKLAKYRTLSDQYKNTLLFDSVFAYEKIKKLQGDEVSYKKMVRESENMLPDGKVKKFISGLTGFEAGMITKDVSKNTLNGQMVKGLDVGYDLGFCQTEFTVGNAEYIGRDGSIDKYTCYSGRINFTPAREQKTSLIYYGYNPSRRMLRQDTFFKDVDLSLPSFREPVHIASVKHSGDILNRVQVETEIATSFRRHETAERDAKLNDKLSYNINLEGEIPRTTINLIGAYDHCGKDFENNSLPVNYSGTDKYMLGSRGVFFKSILTLGVEYNYLVQHNMASKGGNARWGFDMAAKSKRYPSVYLSYKPFTTFRSFDDTLNISQRSMIGDVWNGRVAYQIRRKHHAIQLMMLYNRSHSEMDTLNYTNSMVQFSGAYTNDRLNLALAVGSSANKGSNIAAVHNATKFMNVSVNYMLTQALGVNGGADLGMAAFGLSKYGVNAGVAYHQEKLKLIIRPRFRYGAYKIGEGYQWKNIYNACIDIIWQFNMKINKK